MKKALSIMFALLLLFLLPACGGEEEDDDWGNDSDGDGGSSKENAWEIENDLTVNAMTIGFDGTIYLAGGTKKNSNSYNAFLIVLSREGKKLWEKQWGVKDTDTFILDVVVDTQNNIYVGGRGDNNGYIIKLDSGGNKLWEVFPEDAKRIEHIALDKVGNIYLALESYNSNILKYSYDGKEVWKYDFANSGIRVNDLFVDSKETVYVGGYTERALFSDKIGSEDAFLAKIDTAGAQLVWGKQWGETRMSVNKIIYEDNFIYVTGIPGFLKKFSEDGEEIYQKDEVSIFIAIDSEQNFLVLKKGLIEKYNSNWEKIGTANIDQDISVIDVKCDNDNNFYILAEKKLIKVSASDIK